MAEKTEVKAVPETSREQPRQEETQPAAVAAPAVTDTPSEAVGTCLFPDIEAEKPKEEVVDLSQMCIRDRDKQTHPPTLPQRRRIALQDAGQEDLLLRLAKR